MFDTRISNVHTLITSMLFIYQGNGSLHEVYGVVGGGGGSSVTKETMPFSYKKYKGTGSQ